MISYMKKNPIQPLFSVTNTEPSPQSIKGLATSLMPKWIMIIKSSESKSKNYTRTPTERSRRILIGQEEQELHLIPRIHSLKLLESISKIGKRCVLDLERHSLLVLSLFPNPSLGFEDKGAIFFFPLIYTQPPYINLIISPSCKIS